MKTPPATPARRVKFTLLAEALRRRMRGGELGVGDRLPSFAALEAQFGVTPNTVNRALAVLAAEGLIERQQGRGIFVAQIPDGGMTPGVAMAARDAAQRSPGVPPAHRCGAIGLFVSKSEDDSEQNAPYYLTLFDGVRQAVRRLQSELIFLHDDSPLSFARCDGLLTIAPQPAPPLLCYPGGMPSVALLGKAANAASVTYDEVGGVAEAVAHLVALGHRRIGYLIAAGPEVWPRIESYRAALRAALIKPQAHWMRALEIVPTTEARRFFYDSGHVTMGKWLQEGWPQTGCTALLVQNDDSAVGAIEALQEAGLSVPGDVSVVGFDGSDNIAYFRPRLTTIEVPLHQIGVSGVEVLMELIKSRQSGANIAPLVLPAPLRIGESTARLVSYRRKGEKS